MESLHLYHTIDIKTDSLPIIKPEELFQGTYPNNSYVRFRGVIRQVRDPELIGPIQPNELTQLNAMKERVLLQVELFPFATEWAKDRYYANCGAIELFDNNRKRSQSHATGKVEKRVKMSLEDDNPDVSPVRMSKNLNSSLINVYVYEDQSKSVKNDAFKVNTAFDFVGVFDVSTTERKVDEFEREESALLHCCDAVKMTPLAMIQPHQRFSFYQEINHNNQSIRDHCLKYWSEQTDQKLEVSKVREMLIHYIAESLLGDTVGAEYLVLCLLSRVYTRVNDSSPLGNISINLQLGWNVSKADSDAFILSMNDRIKEVVPLFSELQVAVQDLNFRDLIPHKDYTTDSLLTGALQLPNGTTLTLNETLLSTGKLDEKGYKNVNAVQSLISKMQLPYDFQYFSLDFPQDISIISVSASKSIFSSLLHIPVQPGQLSSRVLHEPAALRSMLECFRMYLVSMRELEVTIGNEQADMAEKYYVNRRKEDKSVTVSVCRSIV